jgi:hypothetical protein
MISVIYLEMVYKLIQGFFYYKKNLKKYKAGSPLNSFNHFMIKGNIETFCNR